MSWVPSHDMHLDALRQMGAHFSVHGGQLDCTAPEGLHGAAIHLPFPSVGATENVMLAAVLAEGRTVLHNAAREPEICDLAAFLRTCGADIAGDGESTLVIRGVERLNGGRYAIMPDRIAGVTYLGAAAITGGTVCLRGVNTQPMENMLPVLEQTGCRVFPEPDRLHLLAPRRLKAVPSIRTMPHPGFPTDAQAIFMAMLSLANGVSVLEENIFENRYRHVDALVKMGAKIHVSGRIAVVTGVRSLSGASVAATDLRGGAAMVLAGLGAQGKTEVRQISHIDRGYESIERAARCGANPGWNELFRKEMRSETMQDVEKTEIQSQTSPKRRRRRNRMRPLYGLLVAALVIGVGVSLSMTVFFNIATIAGDAPQYTAEDMGCFRRTYR
ncbi:MAG: UDP-N-acetylglucosamine 1-carboxyvinyltransferase [Ruminococcus sp.]